MNRFPLEGAATQTEEKLAESATRGLGHGPETVHPIAPKGYHKRFKDTLVLDQHDEPKAETRPGGPHLRAPAAC